MTRNDTGATLVAAAVSCIASEDAAELALMGQGSGEEAASALPSRKGVAMGTRDFRRSTVRQHSLENFGNFHDNPPFMIDSLPMPVPNALTIDVEDWYHICGLPRPPVIPRDERRVCQAVERILGILSQAGVKATFFVLGCVAEEEPELVPMIAREGHEIASHGWSHRLVHQLSEQEFRTEIRRTGEILREQGGKQPRGFRAPQWSISRSSPSWVFSVLQEEGYRYDSSMNPLPFIGDRRGERRPFQLDEGKKLVEFPPLVLQTVMGNLPVGGGWGFRFFPLSMVREAARRMNRFGDPAVFYLHPREVDPGGPRLRLPPLKKFASYGTRTDAAERVRRLLQEFHFTTLEDLVSTWHSA